MMKKVCFVAIVALFCSCTTQKKIVPNQETVSEPIELPCTKKHEMKKDDRGRIVAISWDDAKVLTKRESIYVYRRGSKGSWYLAKEVSIHHSVGYDFTTCSGIDVSISPDTRRGTASIQINWSIPMSLATGIYYR